MVIGSQHDDPGESRRMHLYDKQVRTQKAFRTLLQAMSQPGRVYVMDAKGEEVLLLAMQTLSDQEVTFTVVGEDQERLKREIVKATGSRAVTVEDADFVIIPSGDSEGAVLRAKRGSLDYPHAGATIVYFVDNLNNTESQDQHCLLRGPGIEHEISPCINWLNKNDLNYLREINSEYPLGVDTLFLDRSGRILCIPRSTRVEVK
jgi:alpha-D-ribose 1-methylphosphonate 5-triphosphate synthase subunit PhnH